MDDLWCQHLQNMNLLKESVSMEVYRGRNPLEEFAAQVSERAVCGVAAVLPVPVGTEVGISPHDYPAFDRRALFLCVYPPALEAPFSESIFGGDAVAGSAASQVPLRTLSSWAT